MANDPEGSGNGEEQPAPSLETNNMLEMFNRIRDREKRRILLELIQAIAEDQPELDGGG